MEKSFRFNSKTMVNFGFNTVYALPEYVNKLGGKKVMLLCDPGIASTPILARVVDILKEAEIDHVAFTNVTPEPPVSDILSAAAELRENGCDMCVGLGGGSAMDVAKGVAMAAGNDGKYEEFAGIGNVPKKGLPCIVIPTTAGTGAEVSIICIATKGDSKIGVVDPLIAADAALVDPELTVGLPRKMTAETGVDALAHNIESYLTVTENPLADAVTLEGVRRIWKYLRRAVAYGGDREARYYMAYGSLLGGYAMNLTDGAASVHGLAFALGSKLHVPHGLAVAVMMPKTLAAVAKGDYEKFTNLGLAMGLELYGLPPASAAAAVVEEFEQMYRDIGIPLTLRELNVGLKESDLDMLADEAFSQKRVMGHSVYQMTRSEVLEVFKATY